MHNSQSMIFSKLFSLILIVLTCLIFPAFSIDEGNTAKKSRSSNKLEVIEIHNADEPRSEKEAIVILPGLGDSKKGRRHQRNFFYNPEYDLFIPDYIDKDSFDGTFDKFRQFFMDHKLDEYKKIHVFSYVLGSWIINLFINEFGSGNISTIVYDRSPLQERAPKVIVERIPRIGKMVAGTLLKEFSLVNYSPIFIDDIKIGIIVESKATPLIRRFRKTAMSYGSIDWNNLDFNQEHNDLIFTRLNHDQMYYSFDEIGADIFHFIEHGVFTENARRESYDWDPFKKYKE